MPAKIYVRQLLFKSYFNPIHEGHFWGCSRIRGGVGVGPFGTKLVITYTLSKEDPKYTGIT